MQKLLITFGTRPLAQRLSKMLNNQFEVIFATSEEVPSFLEANFKKIPTAANPTYAHELLKLCLDKEVNYLLPLGLNEINVLAESKILFEEYGIQLLSPSKEALTELYVLENPPSVVELLLVLDGKSLISDRQLESEVSGLFTISDDGDDLALCTI
ncbi:MULTISPECIES: hypothetical protein [Sphingobacterium]|uniref:hypothetical protein n=1 Tax=Sphingobacterium TaxID=28453 RepID=UPI001628394E|nr:MULTISPECIES: hypothetical protein [Sphingobacterium]MBV2226219.1 hypothetical protein [Sphingobacterium mizutaii]